MSGDDARSEVTGGGSGGSGGSGGTGVGGVRQSHFIPFRKADVIDMCLADGALDEPGRKGFRELVKILEALFHYEYHERLETLKDSYAPFNPDPEALVRGEVDRTERDECERSFIDMLREVLTQANFTEIGREELVRHLQADPGFHVRLDVDLDDLAELLVFRRERLTTTEIVKRFRGVVKKPVEVVAYDRVVAYLRFKDADYFDSRGRNQLPFTPGESVLKLFQNVPENGLEMLFPNAKMRMRLADKLLLGVPAAAGSLGLLGKLSGPLLLVLAMVAFWIGAVKKEPEIAAKELVALGLGVFALAMYSYKQLNKVKGRKMKYLKMLSENLYFKVLDNNAGVFHHLIDSAEEEDCKEAVLAYYFILTRKRDFTEAELDGEIEKWFAEKHSTSLDFEVDDAMKKLERLELASREGERLRVKPLEGAKQRLDHIWDNFFTYNTE